MTDATRATFECQKCGEELVIDVVHVHCQCGVLLWSGDSRALADDPALLESIADSHPLPLCAQFSEG